MPAVTVSERSADQAASCEHRQRVDHESACRNCVAVFLLALSLELFAVASFNFFVNPAAEYPFHLLTPVVVTARNQKPGLLLSENPKPQVLIVGSSRVMALSPTQVQSLTGLPAFNAGMEGALIEDDLYILQYSINTAHVKPKLIILGIDVEAFNDNARLLRGAAGLQLSPYYPWRAWMRNFAEISSRLLSIRQTEFSFDSLASRLLKHNLQSDALRTTFDSDGTIQSDSAVAAQKKNGLSGAIREMQIYYSGYRQVSVEQLEYLRELVRDCNQNGIELMIFMTPIEPEVEQALINTNYVQRRAEVRVQLGKLCAEYKIPFRDFTSPRAFDGNDKDFYDGYHYGPRNASLLLSKLLMEHSRALQ